MPPTQKNTIDVTGISKLGGASTLLKPGNQSTSKMIERVIPKPGKKINLLGKEASMGR